MGDLIEHIVYITVIPHAHHRPPLYNGCVYMYTQCALYAHEKEPFNSWYSFNSVSKFVYLLILSSTCPCTHMLIAVPLVRVGVEECPYISVCMKIVLLHIY